MRDSYVSKIDSIVKHIVTLLKRNDYDLGLYFYEVKKDMSIEEWADLILKVSDSISEEKIHRCMDIHDNWKPLMAESKYQEFIKKDYSFTFKETTPETVKQLVDSGTLKRADCHETYRRKIRVEKHGENEARDITWLEKEKRLGTGISTVGSYISTLEVELRKFSNKADIPNLHRLEQHLIQLRDYQEKAEALWKKIKNMK